MTEEQLQLFLYLEYVIEKKNYSDQIIGQYFVVTKIINDFDFYQNYGNSKLDFLCEIRETLDTKRTEAAVCKL